MIKELLKKFIPMPTSSAMREADIIKEKLTVIENEHRWLENQFREIISELMMELNEEYRSLSDSFQQRAFQMEKQVLEINKEIASLKAAAKKNKAVLDDIPETINNDVTRTVKSGFDEFYGKRIASLERGLQRLQELQYEHLDPKLYPHAIEEWYVNRTGEPLDLEHPEGYNEKIQWMKAYYRDERWTLLADKLRVREWVKERIGEGALIPLLGIYRSGDEIDFDVLPNQFVVKANHGSAMNIFVRDKSTADLKYIREKANGWLTKNFAFSNGYELHYDGIPRRILVEQLMENDNGDFPDFKMWCFDGEVKFIEYIYNRKAVTKSGMFDVEWNKLPFTRGHFAAIDEEIPKPDALPELIAAAEKLSAGFPHVRVDLFLLNDKQVKFGEMTFTTASGRGEWHPPEADKWVGEMFHLPR